MAIEYREWREGDDLALLEIWGDPDTFQAGQFRGALTASSDGADGTPWRRTIVAEDVQDGVGIPVAAGVVYEANLHPERLWSYVEVARDHRRSGIGATLLTMLRREWNVDFDDAGAIGRRYRRQDEIGTPFAITVDFESLDDNAVTVRERDTMAQERVSLDRLRGYLAEQLLGA